MATLLSQTTSEKDSKTYMDSLDREFLGSWIQPQHLNEDAMRGYREAFQSHPVNLLVLKDFLHDHVSSALSIFINEEAEVEILYGLNSAAEKNPNHSASVSEEEWLKANDDDRFFRLRKFTRLAAGKRLTANFAVYLKFLSAFKDRRFKAFFESLTGLIFDLNSETYHFYTFKKGDYLRPHSDQIGDYSLAFMLYLSPEWESRFGGTLNINLPDRGTLKLVPEFNNLVLFNVEAQAMHYVSMIKDCAEDRGRSAFSGWLHKPMS